MACTDGNLSIWSRVPDGARLHLSVVDIDEDGNEATDGSHPVTAVARVLEHPTGESVWQDDVIHPGPRSTVLRTGVPCSLLVSVAFAGDARVQVKSWIDKDGTVGGTNFHGDPYCFPVQGTNGTVVTATIFAVPLKQ